MRDEGSRELTSDVAWSLLDSAGNLFAINSASGVISLSPSRELDYESSSLHRIEVQAIATAEGVSVNTQTVVNIDVTNVLESLTIIDNNANMNTLSDSAVQGTAVTGLALRVVDESGESVSDVNWSLVAGEVHNENFIIDEDTGVLRFGTIELSSALHRGRIPSTY